MMKLKKSTTKTKKIYNLSQLGLACQSRNLSHVTEITLLKAILNKLRSSVLSQSNIE